jgi:hypothetical protein
MLKWGLIWPSLVSGFFAQLSGTLAKLTFGEYQELLIV